MSRTILRWLALGCTTIPLGAGLAHVFELPNKLMLDGELWLAVQQNLYRGWGPFIAPFAIVAIMATWILVVMERPRRRTFLLTMVAAACLTTMLAVFFAVVEPVNLALAQWTAGTLPPEWPAYRLRWEVGHVVSCALALIALAALLGASHLERVDTVMRAPRQRHGLLVYAGAPGPPRRRLARPLRADTPGHNVVPLRYRDRLR